MKKIVVLFVILTAFGATNSYGQTPATPPPTTEENKVADFKILTPEEAEKVNIENQKKIQEQQRLASIAEAKRQKQEQKIAKKNKNVVGKALLFGFGLTAVVVGATYLLTGSELYY